MRRFISYALCTVEILPQRLDVLIRDFRTLCSVIRKYLGIGLPAYLVSEQAAFAFELLYFVLCAFDISVKLRERVAIRFSQEIVIVDELLKVFYGVTEFDRYNDGVFDLFNNLKSVYDDKEQKVDIDLSNVAAVLDVVSEIVSDIEQ